MKNEQYFTAESLAIAGGYDATTAHNSIKPPIYQTSTFKFNTAEEGKAFFQKATGEAPLEERNASLIYTRLNHPNAITAEYRLAKLDGAEDAAFFESGMAAISTTLLTFCNAGDLILMSTPLYGGTDAFIKKHLVNFGIDYVEFDPSDSKEQIKEKLMAHQNAKKLKVIYVETPANPTLALTDISALDELRQEINQEGIHPVIVADNTYMGPIFQKPIAHGADINVYSATKYIGGHSDIIAGAASGKDIYLKEIKKKRAILGNTASPFTSWLLSRSLETIGLRMEKQAANAAKLADFLAGHPQVEKLHFLGTLTEEDADYTLYKRQYTSAGAMMAVEIKGGESEAFRFLNALQLVQLAISLGSTETLASHPYTMSSSNMDEADRLKSGITPNLVRISVGIENPEDIIKDVKQALNAV
ncbi:aminotransferase class I/II-fold pyridoxal phosphate-dependent enzyme [Roseivirga pacifica]|uniref:aminotransferase class I/II-fold pyridoxal phosphate-dependent enzyme n=1 Tax=Roseivirga pacifica TaxID=1267423 RepID=UPI003BAC77FF